MSLSFEAKYVLLLNVYFPTTGPDGVGEFLHYIGGITSIIIAVCDEKNLCVIVDFNASPHSKKLVMLFG